MTRAAVRLGSVMVVDGRAHLLTRWDADLVDAVRAIPGRAFDMGSRRWSVALKNDRPRSVLLLVERFSLAIDERDEVLLRAGAANAAETFDLEYVRPVKDLPGCASLCDHWDDAELRGLRDRFECVAHPEVGRLSLVVDQPAARAIDELWRRRDDVRWTRRLAGEVDRCLSRDGAAGNRRVEAAVEETGVPARAPVTVRFFGGRGDLHIASRRRELVERDFPDAVRLGTRAIVVPAERASALGLVRLMERCPDAIVSPSVAAWLPDAVLWHGRVTATAVDGQPGFRVSGDAGEPPERLTRAPASAVGPGTWHVPLSAGGHAALIELLSNEPQTEVDPRAARCLEVLGDRPGAPVPPALLTVEERQDGEPAFGLSVLWDDAAVVGLSTLPGARPRRRPADGGAVGADVVADAWNATSVEAYAEAHGLALDAAARRLLDRLLREHRDGERTVELSSATAGSIRVPGLAGELMAFQAAGVEYALDRRRTFLADEQGLGKTVQALATVEADGALPAIVVCPASLKLNWEREARRWLPDRSVAVVRGRAASVLEADILVLNYEILDAHREALAGLGARALVLDESHYCKNARAKRTQAAQLLSSALPDRALRLALTGTPLVNRAGELAPQLRILGRLEEFGSAASFERTFGASGERERLHWHLRRSCYVRRLKRDVLPQLPAKQRAVVPVGLGNEPEYRRAEASFMAWLGERYRDSEDLARRLDGATRAAALVKINVLRTLVGTGKIRVAGDWIDDFLASGEKLVVFAEHRDVQAGLVERFPQAAHILGTDGPVDRDAAVRRFQVDRGVRLCICSLKAAAHGLTLTAAANVAFTELGWTPAEHDQAEDRCHRIGQASAVTAWYLLAAGTIDERIGALIEHKRSVVGAITDGASAGDEAMVDALLADYVDAPGDRPLARAAA